MRAVQCNVMDCNAVPSGAILLQSLRFLAATLSCAGKILRLSPTSFGGARRDPFLRADQIAAALANADRLEVDWYLWKES